MAVSPPRRAADTSQAPLRGGLEASPPKRVSPAGLCRRRDCPRLPEMTRDDPRLGASRSALLRRRPTSGEAAARPSPVAPQRGSSDAPHQSWTADNHSGVTSPLCGSASPSCEVGAVPHHPRDLNPRWVRDSGGMGPGAVRVRPARRGARHQGHDDDRQHAPLHRPHPPTDAGFGTFEVWD